MLANLSVDFVPDRSPSFERRLRPEEQAGFGHLYPAVERNPRHYFRVHEMFGAAAHLPDSFIGLVPVLLKIAEKTVNQAARMLIEVEARLPAEHERVYDLAVDVELNLLDRVVSDPHG